MEKRGLSIIYDPHNLYQFAWYYCNEGKQKNWDALCLPNGHKGEYMHEYCERVGIFENIYRDEEDYSKLTAARKLKQAAQMFLYFICGKSKSLCEKNIRKYVDLNKYDEIVVLTAAGFISGACVALGRKFKVIILEDGTGDYLPRKRFVPRSRLLSTYAWEGFFLARMGYCCPAWFCFKPEMNCIKYSSHPDMMCNKMFKEIRQLYSKENTDMRLFDELANRMYPELSKYDFEQAETVLFTEPIDDSVKDSTKYVERLEKYINNNYSNVLLKKHPREKMDYHFDKSVSILEIENTIPAEAFLPYLSGKTIIVSKLCSLVIYLGQFNISCKAIIYKGMYEESVISNTQFKSPTKEQMIAYYDRFVPGKYQIIEL